MLGALGAAIGWLTWTLHIRRRVALDGLALAFPERPASDRLAIARENYRNAGRALFEVFSIPRLAANSVEALLEYRGFEIFETAFAAGRGVVVATAHLGSWELLAAVCARRGIPMHVVTRELHGALNASVVRARAASGLHEIHSRGALRAAGAALRRGEVIINLIDQNMPAHRGVFVRFFGEWACTTPAVSLLALRHHAPALVAVAVNLPGGLTRLCVEGPFPVPRAGSLPERIRAHTQLLVSVTERYIRENPAQWFWLHRRWKTRPDTALRA